MRLSMAAYSRWLPCCAAKDVIIEGGVGLCSALRQTIALLPAELLPSLPAERSDLRVRLQGWPHDEIRSRPHERQGWRVRENRDVGAGPPG